MHTVIRRSAVLAYLALLGPLGACTPERPSPPAASVAEAAKEALPTLEQLADESGYASLGFLSLDEVKQVTLGTPLPVMMVRLDELSRYKPGDDPARLIHPTPRTLVPLLVRGDARSSMVVYERGATDRFFVGSFGGAALVQQLETVRRQSMKQTGKPADSYFVVEVSALLLHFVGYHEGTNLMLIPILEDPRLDLPVGRPVPAEQLLLRLVPETMRDFSAPI